METHHYFLIIFLTYLHTTVANTDCPVAQCDCTAGVITAERIIDCRDKDLLGIPQINASNEIFHEITFSSSNQNCGNTCRNKIVIIPDNAFAGLNVRKIDFSLNYLSSVGDNAFSGLNDYLTELILEGNDVVSIPFVSLTNLTNLRNLKIEHYNQDQIVSLPQDFSNLETLVLQTVQLTYINSDAVTNMRKLKHLEIKDNPNYTSFPTAVIRKLTNIEHVSFVQNGLTVLVATGSNAFELNTKFTELDLSHNNIYQLNEGCFDSLQSKLEYLGLHINNLDGSKLSPLASASWSKLEQLILDSNPLGQTGIPSNLFKNMPNLANLNLQQTQLTHIRQNDFDGLANLHFLHLSGNPLIQIDAGAFKHTPNLKELYMDQVGRDSGKFNFTAQTAEGLENLIAIELLNSYIVPDHFWNSMSVMLALKRLRLRDTELSNIPDLTFQDNEKLEVLELQNTMITEVTQAQVHGLGFLKTLDIQRNSITLFDKCVLQELPNLTQLYLANNPLHCDCKLLELYDWAKQKISDDFNFRFIFQAKCSSPLSLKDRLIFDHSGANDIPRDQLVCSGGAQSIQCQTFTTTTPSTTTMSTTTSVVTAAPLPVIDLTINGRDDNNVLLSWTVQNINQLQGFTLTYEELSTGNTKPVPIDVIKRQWTQYLGNSDQEYRICLKATTTDGRTTIPECKISKAGIISSTTISPPSGLTGGEIAAIGVCSAVLVILIVVILIFLLRYKTRPKYKDTPPVHFTAVTRPAVGYDSKRFSKPKKDPKVNGDIIISAISSGKTGEPSSPNSRHSAGSYQYLNENQMVNIQPHLNYTKGANGTSHDFNPKYQNDLKQRQAEGYLRDPKLQNDLKQRQAEGYLRDPKLQTNSLEKSGHSRYAKTPANGQAKQPHQYVNDQQRTSDSLYTNDIKDRPLPKPRIKHYENNNSSGFLNHGFDLDSPTGSAHNSPTENTYNEIDEIKIETSI